MTTRRVATLLIGLAIAVLALTSAAPSAAATPEVQLEGVVLLDDTPAPAGTGITVSLVSEGEDDAISVIECGRTTTVGGGAYALQLSDDCPTGSIVSAFLLAAPGVEGFEIELTDDVLSTNIEFTDVPSGLRPGGGLTPAEQALLQALDDVLAQEETQQKPLIEATTLAVVLSLAIVLGLVLLAYMVFARLQLVEKCDEEIPEAPYRTQIEGMILTMVVLAVILLGVTEKIGQEGLVSVLAAIAGYGAGRAKG